MSVPFARAIVAAAVLLSTSALAQQEPQDREEFDRAAGRAVFNNVPMAERAAFPVRSEMRTNTPPPSSIRPPVRVILASPYGR